MAKLKGFTLAEVLVTLGIIGVVASITMPTLVQNYQKKAFATQLHKVYNELNQAGLSFLNSKNALNMSEAGFNGNEQNFLESAFRVVNNCGNSTTNCLAPSYKSIDGKSIGHIGKKGTIKSCVSIASGASICIGTAIIGGLGSDSKGTMSLGAARVYVDTNGLKGPNTYGRDFFDFVINQDGSAGMMDGPFGNSSRSSLEMLKDGCVNYRELNEGQDMNANDGSCFNYLVKNNWEMDY